MWNEIFGMVIILFKVKYIFFFNYLKIVDNYEILNKMLKIRFILKGFLKILIFFLSNICIVVRECVFIFYSILKYMYSSF